MNNSWEFVDKPQVNDQELFLITIITFCPDLDSCVLSSLSGPYLLRGFPQMYWSLG